MTTVPLRVRRHQLVLKRIERLMKAKDDAIDKLIKSEQALWEARRQAKRYEKLVAKSEPAAERPKLVETNDNGVASIPTEHFDKVVEVPSETFEAPKPKRQFKPRISAPLISSENMPASDHAARMEDLGFRKVGKRKGNTLSTE